MGDRRLRERFLALFFFELAIDAIRRGDRGRRYHFTKDGRFVTLEAERAWRQMLAGQCEALAARFVSVLEESREEARFDRIERRISEGFAEIFGYRSRARAGGPRGAGPIHLVVVSGPNAGEPTAGGEDLRLILGTPGGNVSISQRRHRYSGDPVPAADSPPARKEESALEPRVQDLIELGAAVYMADLQVPRQPNLARRLRIETAVREPEAWEKAREAVERTVAFLGRDDFRIRFVGREPGGELRLDDDLGGDCVCLFSGGLDSAAGAVKLLEEGKRPLLVSHYASSTLAGMQRRLVDRLAERYADRRPDQVGFYVSRSISKTAPHRLDRERQRLMPQALRAFLYLSLASAVAIHRGPDRVYMPENGPLALNPIFSEARTATRSVHPGFLAAFERMLRKAFGFHLRIENPLLYRTKGEAVGILKEAGLSGLVGLTNSCWNWARVPRIAGLRATGVADGVRHDGECLPCIGRRVAVHAAKLSSPDAGYLTDVFADPLDEHSALPQDRQIAILDYLRFCKKIVEMGEDRWLLEVPDLSMAVAGVDHPELTRKLRRGAEELLACFEAQGKGPLKRRLGLAA